MPTAFEPLAQPPVFICGCARSGTTWTCDLFERHPQVHALSETWILTQANGVTGILSQPYWDTKVRAGWEKRVDVPFGAVQLLAYDEMVKDLGELVAQWLMKGIGPDQSYLVTKEPLDLGAAAILFPTARFVHVIRDGRDVALSMRRASESWDPSMGAGLPMEFRAEAWRRQVENLRVHRAHLGQRYLEIRYEDLVADVEAGTRTLFDFTQIPYDEALLSAIKDSTELSSYSPEVRQSGFRGGSRRDGRERLTRREQVAFKRAAGDLLTELGYAV